MFGVVIFISSCIGFYFYSGVEGTDLDIHTIMLVFFSVALYISPTYKPALSSTKLILFFASIGGGIFSLNYLSFYTTLITCPKYYAQNQYVAELIEKSYRFGGTADSMAELVKQYKVHNIHSIHQTYFNI